MEVESRQGIHLLFPFNLDDAIYENVEPCFLKLNSYITYKTPFQVKLR